jgi:uncharacterized protein YacL
MTLRAILLLVGGVAGASVGSRMGTADLQHLLLGAAIGVGVGGAIIWAEYALSRIPVSLTVGGAVGLIAGSVVAGILVQTMGMMDASSSVVAQMGGLVFLLALSYFGLVIGVRVGKEGWIEMIPSPKAQSDSDTTLKLLDTSVIIDGRIADLCETGFIEGTLIVPQFILLELQHISDSSDGLKRARGRRGLDVLNAIQKMSNIRVTITEEDFPNVKEVDSKLVELAKKIDAKIFTNDLNLNKVAGIQGVKILNINELCNALKPVVLPGETIRVFVLKEGKEAGQGVAYLDDGTMVVVDHAKRWIGKNVDVMVTSVLQTSAGRMIFTRLKEETEREELSFARV